MGRQGTLLSLDAFSRTQEDVRIRTRSGGLITVGCMLITATLLVAQWLQFRSVVTRPELVVDRERSAKLQLSLDVTFPSVPCDLVNLDIMDDSANIQLDVLDSGFTKTRISVDGKELGTLGFNLDDNIAQYPPEDENYCGPCYGARDQSNNGQVQDIKDKVCCQTCADVRRAYLDQGWAFFDGKNIEQCEREGYVDNINKHLNEGCRIKGQASINRINGNIHFAPGKAFQNRNGHFHDTSLYDQTESLDFHHTIHHLSFGAAAGGSAPLDDHKEAPHGHNTQYVYFAKLVPTRSEQLDGTVFETTEFTATAHARQLTQGKYQPTTMVARNGIPGLFLHYEISALKVINKQHHALSWSGFLLNCITSIGGVLAVGTVADKLIHRTQQLLATTTQKTASM